jgi:hypothetical protein
MDDEPEEGMVDDGEEDEVVNERMMGKRMRL